MNLMTKNEINVALRKITATIKIARERVQRLAEQAVAHSIVHGDVSIGNNLIEAVSVNKSLRKDSLVAYLEQYGNFCWRKEGKKFEYFFNAKADEMATDEWLAMVTTRKWDEAKKENEITSVYDMEEQVRKFIDKMHKLTADENLNINNRAALDAIERSFVRWSAENALRNMTADDEIVAEGERQQAIADAKAEAPRILLVANQ